MGNTPAAPARPGAAFAPATPAGAPYGYQQAQGSTGATLYSIYMSGGGQQMGGGMVFNHPGQPRAPPAAPRPSWMQTYTIRNEFVVSRDSVRLVPSPLDSSKRCVSLRFSCTAPCAVTVMALCQEVTASGTSRIQSFKTSLASRTSFFGVGKDQELLAPGLELDTTRLLPQHLAMDRRLAYWPVAIMIEAASLEQVGSAPVEARRPAGAEGPGPITDKPCLLAMASVGPIPEGGWASAKPVPCKVERMVLQLPQGGVYELMDIFGAAGSGGTGGAAAGDAGMPPDEDDDAKLCVICLAESKDTMLLPCRHLCVCRDCAQELRNQTSKCPICRGTVTGMMLVDTAAARRAAE